MAGRPACPAEGQRNGRQAHQHILMIKLIPYLDI